MQTLLLRMLDAAQRQTDLLLEQRSLCMEFLDHIDKMDQEHQRFYQTQRSNAPVTTVTLTEPVVVMAEKPSEPLIAVDFRMPNALKGGPVRASGDGERVARAKPPLPEVCRRHQCGRGSDGG